MNHHPNWRARWISVHFISVLGMVVCIFIDMQVALNLQIILQGHPIENVNIVQIVDTFLTRIVNVFLLSQSKLLHPSNNSVLRSIHMPLEMEPTSVAAEPPSHQHYIVLYSCPTERNLVLLLYCSSW